MKIKNKTLNPKWLEQNNPKSKYESKHITESHFWCDHLQFPEYLFLKLLVLSREMDYTVQVTTV